MTIFVMRRAGPRQKGFEVFYARGLRQPSQGMAQPCRGLLAGGFSRLGQTVKSSAGRRAFGSVAESGQPMEVSPLGCSQNPT